MNRVAPVGNDNGHTVLNFVPAFSAQCTPCVLDDTLSRGGSAALCKAPFGKCSTASQIQNAARV